MSTCSKVRVPSTTCFSKHFHIWKFLLTVPPPTSTLHYLFWKVLLTVCHGELQWYNNSDLMLLIHDAASVKNAKFLQAGVLVISAVIILRFFIYIRDL